MVASINSSSFTSKGDSNTRAIRRGRGFTRQQLRNFNWQFVGADSDEQEADVVQDKARTGDESGENWDAPHHSFIEHEWEEVDSEPSEAVASCEVVENDWQFVN